MRRAILLVAVFSTGIIVGGCVVAFVKSQYERPMLQTSFKLNDPGEAAWILNSIETLEWEGANGAVEQFTPQGRIASPGRNLAVRNNKPLLIPDDHGSNELVLVAIADNKAKIGYQSVFYHASFGDNLVTVDSGVVELDVKKKSPPSP
jgi:hypothetical protein